MQQDLAVEREANEAYEHYRAHGRDTQGRRLSRPPKPYEPPETPAGKINTTDLDSRNVKTPRSYTQGYNAQAVVNEHQIVLAAEVTASSPDFGHLEPMVEATKRELEAIGVTETPGVAVADSGYWNEEQMDNVVAQRAFQVLIPPDAGKRDTPRPGWDGGRYASMRERTRDRLRRRALPKTQGDGRAGVRTDQAQPAHQPVSATRQIRRTLRMAADHRHPQPTEAPQAPDSRHGRLKGRPGGHRVRQAAPTARGTQTTGEALTATNLATTTAATLCATPTTRRSAMGRPSGEARSRTRSRSSRA